MRVDSFIYTHKTQNYETLLRKNPGVGSQDSNEKFDLDYKLTCRVQIAVLNTPFFLIHEWLML